MLEDFTSFNGVKADQTNTAVYRCAELPAGQLRTLRAPEEHVEKQGLNSPLLHSFGALPAVEPTQHGETGPRGGGGCGQLDRATGHFWWERPPQATPNPDHRAADAARDDAARDDAARDDAARDDAARDEAAGDEAAGDEAAGDEAAGVEVAGVEAAGVEAAGVEVAEARPRNEPRRQQRQPCCAPDRRTSERSVATRPRPIKDIEST
ncbi:unnamed protein product [Boreogadus saida]